MLTIPISSAWGTQMIFFPGFKKLFISLFLAMLNLCCCASFSLVVASGGYSLVVVRVLLTVAASLVARGL